MAVQRLAALARGARDVDDPAAPGLLHVGDRRADHVEGAGQVDRDHLVPLAVADLLDGGALPDAGVVDEDVQAAEAVDGLVDHHLGLFLDGDVRCEGERFPTGLLDALCDELGRRPLEAVVDGDPGPGAGQQLAAGAADAARAAGHQGGTAFEVDHDGLPGCSRSGNSASCPQAARASPPRLQRMLAGTPARSRASRISSTRWRGGGW